MPLYNWAIMSLNKTDEQSPKKPTSFQQQMGIDRQGLKRGTRIVPMIVLAATAIYFAARLVSEANFELMSVQDEAHLPKEGELIMTNLLAEVRQDSHAGEFYFEAFDAQGRPRIKNQPKKKTSRPILDSIFRWFIESSPSNHSVGDWLDDELKNSKLQDQSDGRKKFVEEQIQELKTWNQPNRETTIVNRVLAPVFVELATAKIQLQKIDNNKTPDQKEETSSDSVETSSLSKQGVLFHFHEQMSDFRHTSKQYLELKRSSSIEAVNITAANIEKLDKLLGEFEVQLNERSHQFIEPTSAPGDKNKNENSEVSRNVNALTQRLKVLDDKFKGLIEIKHILDTREPAVTNTQGEGGQQGVVRTFKSASLSENDKVELGKAFDNVIDWRDSFWEWFWGGLSSFSKCIANDFPLLLKAQLRSVAWLLLLAVIPGLFGMSYRRAFWGWYLSAFAILFGMQWAFSIIGQGFVSAEDWKSLLWKPSMELFLALEGFTAPLILGYCIRRHSVGAISPGGRRSAWIVGGLFGLIGVAILLNLLGYGNSIGGLISRMLGSTWYSLLLGIASIALAFSLFKQAQFKREPIHGKNIVICLDGTWNLPGMKDFGFLAETNVYKLFKMLKGDPSRESVNANQAKDFYLDNNPFPNQVAFYYHGVGNSVENSELGQLFGGAFGLGADAVIERAYLDLVRVYRPGDRIFIFGFSRGAAIARLLAGTIGRRGIPKTIWTFEFFGRHWPLWISSKLFEDVPVEVLGCWDTVGSFGISKNILGIPFQKINLLKNLDVSLCVKRAYHMVALDETRDCFEATLMDPDPIRPNRIVEVWFSGNHSNVGGGYADDKLSDVALDFLLSFVSSDYEHDGQPTPGTESPGLYTYPFRANGELHVPRTSGDGSWGLYLNARRGQKPLGSPEDPSVVDPDPRGGIRESTGAMYTLAPRKMPLHAVISDTVFDRMRESIPVYAPQSLLNLNEELFEKQQKILNGVDRLKETGSLKPDDCIKIQNWSRERLSLTKWSDYLKTEFKEQNKKLKDMLNPSEELKNPIKV